MENLKTWIWAGLALLVVIVGLQNTAEVETRVLFMTVTMPRAVLIFVTVAVGFVLGMATAGWLSRRSRKSGGG